MQSFAVFSQPGPSEPGGVSNVTLTNSVNPGETWMFKGEEYLYCYNASNSAINVGQYVTLSSASGYSVTASSITNYDFPIAVCKHATLPTAAYGWLLTRGWTSINLAASNSATTSDVLAPAGSGYWTTVGQLTPITAMCALVLQGCGYVTSGAASAASGPASGAVGYVRLYGT